jgi:hypothetical protein
MAMHLFPRNSHNFLKTLRPGLTRDLELKRSENNDAKQTMSHPPYSCSSISSTRTTSLDHLSSSSIRSIDVS